MCRIHQFLLSWDCRSPRHWLYLKAPPHLNGPVIPKDWPFQKRGFEPLLSKDCDGCWILLAKMTGWSLPALETLSSASQILVWTGPERLQCKGCPPLLVVEAIYSALWLFSPASSERCEHWRYPTAARQMLLGFQPLMCRPGIPGAQSKVLMRQGQMFGSLQIARFLSSDLVDWGISVLRNMSRRGVRVAATLRRKKALRVFLSVSFDTLCVHETIRSSAVCSERPFSLSSSKK